MLRRTWSPTVFFILFFFIIFFSTWPCVNVQSVFPAAKAGFSHLLHMLLSCLVPEAWPTSSWWWQCTEQNQCNVLETWSTGDDSVSTHLFSIYTLSTGLTFHPSVVKLHSFLDTPLWHRFLVSYGKLWQTWKAIFSVSAPSLCCSEEILVQLWQYRKRRRKQDAGMFVSCHPSKQFGASDDKYILQKFQFTAMTEFCQNGLETLTPHFFLEAHKKHIIFFPWMTFCFHLWDQKLK